MMFPAICSMKMVVRASSSADGFKALFANTYLKKQRRVEVNARAE
jgi:hypothetical protein